MAKQSDGAGSRQATLSEHTARSVGSTVPPGAIFGRNGGILTPWRPGQRGNPENKRPDDYLACIKLCRERSPEAVEKVSDLMRSSADERVQYMAATWLVERAFGKAKDYDPREAANTRLRFDIDALTLEERAVLLAIIRRGAIKQATGDDDTNASTLDAAATETPPA